MATNSEWVKSLKVGDKVIIRNQHYGDDTYAFDVVKSISPKRGDIKLEKNGHTFSKDGSYYGGQYSRYSSKLLEPTEENTKIAKDAIDIAYVKGILNYLNENRNRHVEVMRPYLPQLKEIYKKVNEAEEAAKQEKQNV